MIYSDEMGTSQSVTKTYVAMTGSPYSPLTDGKLVTVKLLACGDAATSLIEGVQVKVECPLWGVPLTVATVGAGLRTVPQLPIPVGVQNCDLQVRTGVQITVQIKNVTADTPVTPQYVVIGVFEG